MLLVLTFVGGVLLIVRDLPADGDGGGRSPFANVDTAFSRALRFSLQVAAHDDSGHDYGAAAEHDVRLALDVGFAGDFVACVLMLMLVVMTAEDDVRSMSRVVDDICKPTVSIYSALTERLLTGRDMAGECQGRLVRAKLQYYCFTTGQLYRAGRIEEQKRCECVGRRCDVVLCRQMYAVLSACSQGTSRQRVRN